ASRQPSTRRPIAGPASWSGSPHPFPTGSRCSRTISSFFVNNDVVYSSTIDEGGAHAEAALGRREIVHQRVLVRLQQLFQELEARFQLLREVELVLQLLLLLLQRQTLFGVELGEHVAALAVVLQDQVVVLPQGRTVRHRQ